jgi:hypothetical protein
MTAEEGFIYRLPIVMNYAGIEIQAQFKALYN